MSTTTLADTRSFIEAQFPVSKVSKESYKERKSNHSQTLTGLGKWWGRKPLVMIRAAILGLLFPPSDDPKKDREIFLKIMTMDEGGLWQRKSKNIKYAKVYDLLTEEERALYFNLDEVESGKAIHHCIDSDSREEKREIKEQIQQLAFSRLSYDDKLNYCDRPEQIEGPSEAAWEEINAHLGTSASSLSELVQELGERQFGHTPRVGDAFCGGGSVPFEAARLGCEAYGSDLNPVAALLTWASLNIVGGGEEVAEQVRDAQEEVYAAVDEQITEWGIEHNDKGWRADAYLYCLETECPECGVDVPLAPSWVIGKRTKTIARLELNEAEHRFEIHIEQSVSNAQIDAADEAGTVQSDSLHCPACERSTPMRMIRGDRRGDDGTTYGLRMWENDDVVPRPDDTFQERLYCIRWVETHTDADGNEKTHKHYRSVTDADQAREAQVLQLLEDRFDEWQEKGYIPSRRIEPGYNTNQPIREQGWTYWHHLFNARQLFVHGALFKEAMERAGSPEEKVYGMMCVGRVANWNARLTMWTSHHTRELNAQVFMNQALNTFYNYGGRSLSLLGAAWRPEVESVGSLPAEARSTSADVRDIDKICDLWITDPPYSDAINYHELSEFFLAWYEKPLQRLFPEWYTDSKRALAITGDEEVFRRDMVESYRNLAEHMPDDGAQIVMFTHQDASVWADLALIMWAAGLRVTAAWTIATETESAYKKGNYVQGTVLLVLRKRTEDQTAFTDQIKVEVEEEVTSQLDAMLAIDEDETDPSFGDTDYQLAAYAAALRVLTSYSSIEEWDIQRELSRSRKADEPSPIVGIIDSAVKIANDHLIPDGFDSFLWKTLGPEERLYLKGLELESHGEFRTGAYQELARGTGVTSYSKLFANSRANETRFKNASEFGSKMLGDDGFAGSHVRAALFAVYETRQEGDAQAGRMWLSNEVADYWSNRKKLIEILQYLAAMGRASDYWEDDAEAARILAGAVENHHQ